MYIKSDKFNKSKKTNQVTKISKPIVNAKRKQFKSKSLILKV